MTPWGRAFLPSSSEAVRPVVGIGDAEDVGVGDGLGGQAGAQDVADHAADAGGRAAVGLDGGGVVVRLDLEADRIRVVEGDDAGVVLEDGEAEVLSCPG